MQLRALDPRWTGYLPNRLGDDCLSVGSTWSSVEATYVSWMLERARAPEVRGVWRRLIAELGTEVTADGATSEFGTHVPGVLAAAENIVNRGDSALRPALDQELLPGCSLKLGDMPLAWAWATCTNLVTPGLAGAALPAGPAGDGLDEVRELFTILRRTEPFSETSERVLGWLFEGIYHHGHPVSLEIGPDLDFTPTATVVEYVTSMARALDLLTDM